VFSWNCGLQVAVPSDRKKTRKSRQNAERAVVSQHKLVITPPIANVSTLDGTLDFQNELGSFSYI
jgi:hypothetical protein